MLVEIGDVYAACRLEVGNADQSETCSSVGTIMIIGCSASHASGIDSVAMKMHWIYGANIFVDRKEYSTRQSVKSVLRRRRFRLLLRGATCEPSDMLKILDRY